MSELHRIRWQDVDTVGRRLYIYKSKSKQFRVVPMTPRLSALFESLRSGRQWLQSQNGHSRKAIVWPDDSKPSAVVIPPIDIKKSLISAAKKIGADHIHPHQFRHTYATRLMDQGVPMEPYHGTGWLEEFGDGQALCQSESGSPTAAMQIDWRSCLLISR